MYIFHKNILIYQPDAFVFSDELLDFCNLKYDYIGAPWINGLMLQPYMFRGSMYLNKVLPFLNKPNRYYVGNGGLSLRNVQSSIKLLNTVKTIAHNWYANEDVFWSVYGTKLDSIFKIAPFKVALQFAFELEPEQCFSLNNNKLPFGCHAWAKYNIDFMRTIFHEYGYEI